MLRHLSVRVGVWCAIAILSGRVLTAAEPLTSVLPPDAVVSAELMNTKALLRQLQNSDVLKAVLASDQYKDWTDTDQGRKFRGGVAVAEAQLGTNLWDAADRLVGNRLAIAAYLPKQDGDQPDSVLVVQFADEGTGSWLREKLTPLLAFAGDGVTASERDGAWILESKDGKGASAIKGEWLVISNQTSLRDDVLGRIAGSQQESLAASLAWKQALASPTEETATHMSVVWDAAPLKARMGTDRFLPREVDNPLGSLLIGGMLEVAAVSSHAHATVTIDDAGFKVRLQTPVGASNVDPAHQTLLATAQEAKNLAPAVPRQLAGFTLVREWAQWYRQREELLVDQVLPEFDKFETGLSTFLPGKDFCEDVLSLLNPPMSFVAAEQTYPHLDGRPAMQLPAFAAVFDMTDAARGSDVFQLFFQTAGTITNIEAGKYGRQPWVMSSETHRDTQVTFAKYLDRPTGAELGMVYNFQPASAVVGNRFIVASSLELCRDLIDAIQDGKTSATAEPALRNLEFSIDPLVGASLLESNRPIVTAQGVQSGRSLDQANRDLDYLLQILRRMTTINVMTDVSSDRVELRLEGGWK